MYYMDTKCSNITMTIQCCVHACVFSTLQEWMRAIQEEMIKAHKLSDRQM